MSPGQPAIAGRTARRQKSCPPATIPMATRLPARSASMSASTRCEPSVICTKFLVSPRSRGPALSARPSRPGGELALGALDLALAGNRREEHLAEPDRGRIPPRCEPADLSGTFLDRSRGGATLLLERAKGTLDRPLTAESA